MLWKMQMSLQSVWLALTAAAITGVVFGFLPARKASLLDPIEALEARLIWRRAGETRSSRLIGLPGRRSCPRKRWARSSPSLPMHTLSLPSWPSGLPRFPGSCRGRIPFSRRRCRSQSHGRCGRCLASQRLVRQFSDAAGGAIAIWSRKAGATALWRFPDDPYLPGLAEWWRNPRDADGRGLTGLKVLRYVPTRRVTISAERELDGTAGRIIVKFKRRSKIEQSAAMLEAVYDAARVQDPKLAIARPLGKLDDLGAFCQAFLDGAPFDEASQSRIWMT